MAEYPNNKALARAREARTIMREGRDLAGMSQEELAEYLRLDPRTVRRYESGELPVPDSVMLEVTELAGRPLLLYRHFKEKYGISDEILPPVTEVPLAVAAVNLLHELEKLERSQAASKLLALSADGVIDPGEESDFAMILGKLDGVCRAAALLRYHRKED